MKKRAWILKKKTLNPSMMEGVYRKQRKFLKKIEVRKSLERRIELPKQP
jgi:hypothetical protein